MHSERDDRASAQSKAADIPFIDAVYVWLRIGLLSFGGPAGQIALMHRILVEEKAWIAESRFLHALNFCMLLPGPEAQQLAIYSGWLLHRIKGGVVAGVLFVLPGALVILVLSILYAGFQQLAIVGALFFGIKAAVLAVIVEALIRIAGRALTSVWSMTIAALAFLGIAVFDIGFPLIIVAAGVLGYVLGRLQPDWLDTGATESKRAAADDSSVAARHIPRPTMKESLRLTVVCLGLWLLPTFMLAVWLGNGNVYVQEGVFFSKMAVVTFGGAYAVLAYVAQQAVDVHHWLAPGEMLDGLGLAESTPGPLILVVQFVGFMGAYRNPGMLDPVLAGTLGAMLTTWVTFVPCFLWIFLGAPYIEALRGNRSLTSILTAITAAIVGVILNLAVWFGTHVLFSATDTRQVLGVTIDFPILSSVDPVALLLTVGALVAMRKFGLGMLQTLVISAIMGTLFQFFS